MSKIAADVVLLLPDEANDLAIRLSQDIAEKYGDDILLNNDNCLPHITLRMGLIETENIIESENILDKLAEEFLPINLEISSLKVSDRKDGTKASSLTMRKADNLIALHYEVVDRFADLFSYDNLSLDMFYSPPVFEKPPSYWEDGSVETEIRERYSPHVSLGFGVTEISDMEFPIRFTSKQIALCHLGRHSTCRKVLTSSSR